MYSGISPYDMDWTDLNEIERKMKIRKGVKKLFISDPNIIENETENIFGTIIPDENRQYLYMMKSFCDMNGAQLVLIKNPVITLPIFYRASWTKSKSDSIRNLAYENGIEFIDLQYDYDLRIDWKHDTKDGGMHLNYDGAKKITDFFCNYLIHHDVYGEHNSIINSFLDKYNKHTELAELHLESDFSNYIQKLKTFSDSLCIFMSICDTGMSELLEEEKEQLKRIGLKEFDNAEWSNSYLSIINENKVILDSLSDSGQSFSYVMPNDIKVDLVSRDFLSDSFCSIKIKEVEYALNQRGLNIVVFDKDANMVIDSCVFDFWSKDEHKAIRNNRQLYYMLFDYEFYLCGYQGK